MADKEDIQAVYDVGNDFFFLWLDTRRIYSCGVWDGDTRTLEQSQVNKLERLGRFGRVTQGSRLLDIGCGWGGALRFFLQEKGVSEGVGLTLSEKQLEAIQEMRVSGLEPRLISWRDYEPDAPFDAIVSMGAFEHFANIQDRVHGRIAGIYREFFESCHRWSKPGSYLALHTVVGGLKPWSKEDFRDMRHNIDVIFQNSVVPFLEEVIRALRDFYEIEELVTIRVDYAKTAAEWLSRLREHRDTIIRNHGAAIYERYERYLQFTVKAFEKRYGSVAQMSLKRAETLPTYKTGPGVRLDL